MKLLYTITAYPPSIGGAQLHAHSIAQQIQQHHDIQVASFWNTNRTDWLLGTTLKVASQAEDYTIDNIPVHRIGLPVRDKAQMLLPLVMYYPAMRYMLPPIAARILPYLDAQASNADIIHNFRIGREPLSYASYELARKKHIPFVFTPFHHPRWVGWRYEAYLRLYRAADTVITLTHREKEILIELGVQAERVTVTGMGPILAAEGDAQGFRERHKLTGPVVLFAGQHYLYKGYRQLLEATRFVWDKVPEANFVFIGPSVGDSEEYFAMYKDHRIHRLGKVSLQEKTNALATCDLLCVPSTQESFGGVYTEAWAFKKPVIGCNIPAVAEVIQDGERGLLVEQQAASIAEGIITLLLNPNAAEKMGQCGYDRLQQRYTWDKIGQQMDEVYIALHAGHTPRQLFEETSA